LTANNGGGGKCGNVTKGIKQTEKKKTQHIKKKSVGVQGSRGKKKKVA